MHFSSYVLILALGLLAQMGYAQNHAYEAYIQEFGPVAIAEMERTGIPASIKMAQAILESNAGRSDLARRANNHFGIKCGGSWSGKSFSKKDDDRHKGRLVKSCFRSYRDPMESFMDHSEFLQSQRYKDLYRLKPDDYKGWARGLKKAGYATSRTYHSKLINLIEQYDLDELDRMSTEQFIVRKGRKRNKYAEDQLDDLLGTSPGRLVKESVNNDVRCLIPARAMPVNILAEQQGVRVKKILKYNENLESGSQLVEAGQPVYLQPKRKSYRGRDKWHVVKQGETMMDISLAYGIDLEKLQHRNRMPDSKEPAYGERIKLRGGKLRESPRFSEVVVRDDPPRPQENEVRTEELDFVVAPSAVEKVEPEKSEKGRPAAQLPAPEPTKVSAEAPRSALTDPFATPVVEHNKPSYTEKPAEQARPAPPTGAYYQVMKGDTLWSIARMHNLSIEDLKELNALKDATITSGMKLRVK